jgi:hypothetical protein
MWKNNYDAVTDTFDFTDEGIVSGAATCTEGWGVDIFDRGMRLHDVEYVFSPNPAHSNSNIANSRP